MRNLTITRTKSFVASLGKMKVYIEDPFTGDTVISGVNCRKLGDLKNGETATFPIGEEAARVYVIADQVSKNYSNDYYPLEAGTEDVVLTGKNHFNPGAGNPFRFDGVTDETVLTNRKKGGRKGILILVISALIGFAIGMSRTSVVKPQDFTVADMTITLNSEFQASDFEGFTQCYVNRDVGVSILQETYSQYPVLEDYTLADYGDAVIWSNGLTDSTLTTYDDFMYFTYTASDDQGNTFCYLATVHEGGNGFWLIQFSTLADEFSEQESQFLEWASSVRFD